MILGTRKNVTYHNSNKFQFEDALHNLCTLLRLLSHIIVNAGASLVAQTVKNLPAMPETRVLSLGLEDPLEKGMAPQSSILAWRIPMDRGAWRATIHWVAESNIPEVFKK